MILQASKGEGVEEAKDLARPEVCGFQLVRTKRHVTFTPRRKPWRPRPCVYFTSSSLDTSTPSGMLCYTSIYGVLWMFENRHRACRCCHTVAFQQRPTKLAAALDV